MFSKVVFLCAALLGTALVQAISLHGRCESDDHCGVVDSYCNNGTCVCKQSFAYHDDACIQLVDPRLSCMANTDCQPTLGPRSICKDASCACLPNHHLHNTSCIKNRGLHERCDEDFQCYWGQEMIERMSCISGECTCKPGYRPHNHRRCESGATSNMAMSAASALVLMILSKIF